MATDAMNSNSATTVSQEENHNISNISNATNSMPMHPPQPMIPNQPQQQPTLDDFINTALSIEEKRKLRFDLLSLPPEKLGEIMYVLQKSQPQNIEQKGDELEIDLKKLNTKTLRHLQRYVESVFAKVRYNSMNAMVAPPPPNPMYPQMQQPMDVNYPQQRRLEIGDLLPNGRKRSYEAMGGYNIHGYGFNDGMYRPQRKKRSAFTSKQKEEMIQFWQTVNWQAIPDDEELELVGRKIGVTVPQLKVFRQNNRKKYGKAAASSSESSPNKSNANAVKNENESETISEQQKEEEVVEEEQIVEIGKVPDADSNETTNNTQKNES